MCGPLRCPRCGSSFISGKPAEKTLRGGAQGHTGTDWSRDPTPVPRSLSPVCPPEGRGAVVRGLKPRAHRQSREGGQPPAPEEGGRTRWVSGGEGAARAAPWAQALGLPWVSVSGATGCPSSGEGGPRPGEAHQRASALLGLGPLQVGLGSGRGPFPKRLRSGPVRSLSNFTSKVTRLRMLRLRLGVTTDRAAPRPRSARGRGFWAPAGRRPRPFPAARAGHSGTCRPRAHAVHGASAAPRPLADARCPARGGLAVLGQRGRGRHVMFGCRLRPSHRPSRRERTEIAREPPGPR